MRTHSRNNCIKVSKKRKDSKNQEKTRIKLSKSIKNPKETTSSTKTLREMILSALKTYMVGDHHLTRIYNTSRVRFFHILSYKS